MNEAKKNIIAAQNLSKHFGPVQPVRKVQASLHDLSSPRRGAIAGRNAWEKLEHLTTYKLLNQKTVNCGPRDELLFCGSEQKKIYLIFASTMLPVVKNVAVFFHCRVFAAERQYMGYINTYTARPSANQG